MGHQCRPCTWPALEGTLQKPLFVCAFIRRGPTDPNDLDAVVMAIAVLMPGACRASAATITWLEEVVRSGRDAAADRYYQGALPLNLCLFGAPARAARPSMICTG